MNCKPQMAVRNHAIFQVLDLRIHPQKFLLMPPPPLFHLAGWLQDRMDSRQLKAKIAILEEEFERMGSADPLPVHEQVNDGEFQKSWDLLISFLGRGAW
jgi:hypothetical protein